MLDTVSWLPFFEDSAVLRREDSRRDSIEDMLSLSHREVDTTTGRRPIKQAAEKYMLLSTNVQLASVASSPVRKDQQHCRLKR